MPLDAKWVVWQGAVRVRVSGASEAFDKALAAKKKTLSVSAVVVVDAVAYVITALSAAGSLRGLGLGLLVDGDDFALHGAGLGGGVSDLLVVLLVLLLVTHFLLLLSTVVTVLLLVMLPVLN